MREIRFRAWDKGKKIFLDLSKPSVILLNDEIIGYYVLLPDGKLGSAEVGGIREVKNIEINFYTGWRDKNGKGKDVYHKDIFPGGGIVEWFDYGWFVIFPTYEIPLSDYLRNDLTREVIGNYYETPELLESKNEYKR